MRNLDEIRRTFNEIYERNDWGNGSGYGSTLSATKKYRRIVRSLIKKHAIGSVVELGCGDFRVMKQVLNDDISYTGYDVASEVISANRLHSQSECHRFEVLTNYSLLANASLLICKDVLQHLPTKNVQFIVEEIFPRYEHVLVTNCVGHRKSKRKNEDIDPGSFTNLDLLSEPFNVPGEVLLEWDAPLTSVFFPYFSFRNILISPLVLFGYIRMSAKAFLSGDYENHPRWRKQVIYQQNCSNDA